MDMLAPMRLYTLTRRHFALVFVGFFACFSVMVFVGVAGPKIIIQNTYNVMHPSANGSMTGPFHLKTPPLSNYNQQLWLICIIQMAQNNEEDFRKKFEIDVDLKGVMQDASITHISDNMHQKLRILHCTTSHWGCDEVVVMHLGYLSYMQYQINISLKGLEHISKNIQNVTFMMKMFNPTFSQFEIWFRFVFVVMTFIVTCMFVQSMKKFSMRHWAIEQKWMSLLLPLLLLYNDPFYPLSFLMNSWFPGTLDTFFQALFLCSLLLFWLCIYHGIRIQGERKCLTFHLPKLVIVGLLWISAITLDIWQLTNELHDPTYQYKMDIQNFQGVKVFFFVLVALYFLYLVYLLVRSWSELKNIPYSGLRLRFLTALTLLVLSISMVIFYLPFSLKDLQDNFETELSVHSGNSAKLSFYGLLNFYLYTLAFIYSPCKNTLYDFQLKDNSAFSMLNDSDDEVIYGCDEVMPLQNGSSIKATINYHEETDSD